MCIARIAFQRANGAETGAHRTNEAIPRMMAQFSSRLAACSRSGSGETVLGASYGFGVDTGAYLLSSERWV